MLNGYHSEKVANISLKNHRLLNKADYRISQGKKKLLEMDISKCSEVFPNIEEIVTAYSNTRHHYNDAILKLFSRNRKKVCLPQNVIRLNLI